MRPYTKFLGFTLIALTSVVATGCKNDNPVDNIDLIPVTLSKEGKWSMINDKGEVVYESEFKNQPSVSYNGFFSVKEDKGFTVYKAGGKNPEPVKDLDKLKSVGYYENGLIPATLPKQRIGIYDEKGNRKFELAPVADVEIVSCDPAYSEERLLIKTAEDKYGYYDTKGKLAIKPSYDRASTFEDGMAIVGKYDDPDKKDDMNYSVIDITGKEIMKIKSGYDNPRIEGGYILATKEDRTYLFDKKAEQVKLPEKIKFVREIQGDYIIFANDEYEYGVADLKGEILIRPKYSNVIFDGDDHFLAKKDNSDKEIVRLDSNGEEVGDKIDYEEILPMGKFGYLAKEGSTIVLLNDKFKKKNKDEYYNMGLNLYAGGYGGVETDYFNPEAVALVIVNMIEGNKVGNLTLGANAATVMQGKSPRDYTYRSNISADDLNKEGFRYSISVNEMFTENIADYRYDYYSYSYDPIYYWNSDSKLGAVIFNISTQSEWGKDGMDALAKALQDKGFKAIKEGEASNDSDQLANLYKKGNVLVLTMAQKDGQSGTVSVFDGTIPDIERTLSREIVKISGDSSRMYEPVEEDSAATIELVEVATEDTVAYY